MLTQLPSLACCDNNLCSRPGKFKHVADLAGGHDAPISDLSSDAADATSGTMLSSDGAGLVILWDIAKLIPLLKEGGEIPMIQLSAPGRSTSTP